MGFYFPSDGNILPIEKGGFPLKTKENPGNTMVSEVVRMAGLEHTIITLKSLCFQRICTLVSIFVSIFIKFSHFICSFQAVLSRQMFINLVDGLRV